MSTETLHFVKKSSYERIGPGKAARLRYAVVDRDDDQTLEYRDDLHHLHGAEGGAFARLAEALEGLGVDESTEVEIGPEEGFGAHDPDLVMTVPAEAIPAEAREVGTRLDGEGPDGHTRPFRVVAIDGERITVDGNHALAGRNLRFIFEVLEVRAAREEEIAAGYAFPAQEAKR